MATNFGLPGDVLKHIDERVTDMLSPIVQRANGYGVRRGKLGTTDQYKVTHELFFDSVKAKVTIETSWDEDVHDDD